MKRIGVALMFTLGLASMAEAIDMRTYYPNTNQAKTHDLVTASGTRMHFWFPAAGETSVFGKFVTEPGQIQCNGWTDYAYWADTIGLVGLGWDEYCNVAHQWFNPPGYPGLPIFWDGTTPWTSTIQFINVRVENVGGIQGYRSNQDWRVTVNLEVATNGGGDFKWVFYARDPSGALITHERIDFDDAIPVQGGGTAPGVKRARAWKPDGFGGETLLVDYFFTQWVPKQ